MPISSVMSCAICSTRRSTASAALRSTSPRAAAGSRDQVGNAVGGGRDRVGDVRGVRRAGTRRSISDGRHGPCFSYVAPERLGRHSPPTKLANAGPGRGFQDVCHRASAPLSSGRPHGRRGSRACRSRARGSRPAGPACSVKSSGGTRPVPVSRTLPAGTGLSRRSQETSSSNERFMRAVDVSPANSSAPSGPRMRSRISKAVGAPFATSSAGPSRARAREQLRLRQVERVLALDRARGDVVADRVAGDVAVLAEHEPDLRLRDVPGRVGSGRRSVGRARRCAGRAASFRNSSGRSAP